MSQTKNTLLMILKQQIQELRPKVMEMNQDSLIQNVAKLRVIYNITRHSNTQELVYGYLALCEYYISNQLYEPAIKNLMEALDVHDIGDIYYQLGLAYYSTKKNNQAFKMLEKCLKVEWIEPSLEHQLTNKLQALSMMQKIQFIRVQMNPQKKEIYQEELIKLSYEKIDLTKKSDCNKNFQRGENQYYSLTMADLAEIYSKLGQYEQALQKINTAISMYDDQDDKSQLISFLLLSAQLNDKLGRQQESFIIIQRGIAMIKEDNTHKLDPSEQELYYMFIRKSLKV